MALPAKEEELKALLVRATPRVEQMLPARMTDPAMRARVADKMVRVALLAASRQPALAECSPQSVLQSVVIAATLGLELGGVLGEGYLVPFNVRGQKVCQFVPGYRGLVKLAVQTGSVRQIEARLAYKEDFFKVELGTEPKITHVPAWGSDRSDKDVTHAYMVATLSDGTKQFEVMTRAEIEKVRRSSKAANAGPWVDWWPEQAKKTVIKRGTKLLPLTPDEFRLAVELDTRAELGGTGINIPELDGELANALHATEQTKRLQSGLRETLGVPADREIEGVVVESEGDEPPFKVNESGEART